ncbi:MAG TPA: DUF924 family protein, partial [Gammaproteobacteria bacterium]|nr:DUF924 family protein [Gammaproteobacteria bacterium]
MPIHFVWRTRSRHSWGKQANPRRRLVTPRDFKEKPGQDVVNFIVIDKAKEMLTKTDILDFWFSERVSKFWFRSTDEFDTELRMKYSPVLEDAVAGKRQAWAETA